MKNIIQILNTENNKVDQLDKFTEFLMIEIANGTPTDDTVRTYLSHTKCWIKWCIENQLDPMSISDTEIKHYRAKLIKDKLEPTSIAVKLSAIRQFYQAAIQWKLIEYNPALHIKAPRIRKSIEETTKFLEVSKAKELLKSVNTSTLAGKRDLIVIALMLLHGLRVCEVANASVEDIEAGAKMRIIGKGENNAIQLRKDVYSLIESYLKERLAVTEDIVGTPLIVSYSGFHKNKRMSRGGVRDIVEKYLKIILTKENTKEFAKTESPHLSCHALRHTFATILYKKTHDLKVVQKGLRHSDLSNVGRYAHILDELPQIMEDVFLE